MFKIVIQFIKKKNFRNYYENNANNDWGWFVLKIS